MKRYSTGEWENEEGELVTGDMEEDEAYGDYVLYEEARQIEVDRDIKAANLQLLVDKVLAYDSLDDRASVEDIVLAYEGMISLARSLKQ